MGNQFFISYKSEYASFTEKLHDDLEAMGFDIWLDKRHLKPGENWERSIQKALRECRFMIAVITPEAIESNIVQAEWNYFLSEKNKIVFPILLKTCEEIPFRLLTIQYTDFRQKHEYEGSFKSLVGAFHQLLESLGETLPALSTNEMKVIASTSGLSWQSIAKQISLFSNGTLGVRYKEKFSSEYYFKRQDIEKHFESFLAGDKRVMTVTGKAGTGKSSFVCSITTQRNPDITVWLQDCAHLGIDEDESIASYIAKTLHIPPEMGLLDVFDSAMVDNPNKRIILLFDAVNEYSNPPVLLGKISEFVLLVTNPQIKIIVTCRIPMWNTIKRHFTVPPQLEFHPGESIGYVNLETFDSKNISEVYEKYRSFFRIKTPFSQLSEKVVKIIEQPLFLKLMAIVFQDRDIPQSIDMEDVFKKYVAYCIIKDKLFDIPMPTIETTEEYIVLSRTISLMYEQTKRELELIILGNDSEIGEHITSDILKNTPYRRLVGEGLLSEKIDPHELVSITYERVFEYLLAEIVIAPVTVDKILTMLDIAKKTSFIQLRGAVELALAYAIINKKLTIESVIELSSLDKSESRQFLCDVMQTINSSGYTDLVKDIINKLVENKQPATSLLAAQASYQLKLDDYLVKLALSQDEDATTASALFLYQRWNTARIAGNLEDAYKPLNLLASKIRVQRPQESAQAIASLIIITINIFGHVIEDKKALEPVIQLWQDLAKKVGAISPLPTKSPTKKLAKLALDTLIFVGSKVTGRFLKQGLLDNKKITDEFWGKDPINRRAFMDSGAILFDLDSIVEYKDQLIRLMSWDNVLPPYVLTAPLTMHLYKNPDVNVPFLQDIFDEIEVEEKAFRTQYLVLFVLAYSGLFRLLKSEQVADDYLERLQNNLIEFWYTAHEDIDGKYRYEVEGTISLTFESTITLIMTPIFSIESYLQRNAGKVEGSHIFHTFIETYADELTAQQLQPFLKSLEFAAYQGFPEFAIYTLLDKQIRTKWEELIPDYGIRTLAKIRAFFQDEVDGIISPPPSKGANTTPDDEKNLILFNKVRMESILPEIRDVLFTNTNFLSLSIGVEIGIRKIGGGFLISIATAKSLDDLIRKWVHIVIASVFDFDYINIMFAQWYVAHDPKWDGFEKYNISRDIYNEREDIREYWTQFIGKFVEEHGRGMFFDE